MTTAKMDRIGKVLWQMALDLGRSEEDSAKILDYLEECIGPLLRAGQAMRDKSTWIGNKQWDDLLAALEVRE
jgi:hypothetical protein